MFFYAIWAPEGINYILLASGASTSYVFLVFCAGSLKRMCLKHVSRRGLQKYMRVYMFFAPGGIKHTSCYVFLPPGDFESTRYNVCCALERLNCTRFLLLLNPGGIENKPLTCCLPPG